MEPSLTSLPLPPLGRNWLNKFRKRHPQVASVWSRQLDTSRLDAAVPEKHAPWFAEIGTILDRNRYKPKNVFNMDETGHGIGTTQSTRCLVIRDMSGKGKGQGKKATKGTSGRQEWVTTIECVSAAGRALPALVIFKATGSFNTRWLPEELEVQGSRWTTSIPVGRTTLSHTIGSNASLSVALHTPPPPLLLPAAFSSWTVTAVMSRRGLLLSA